jgi:predicted transcriptional regulator YheO
MEKQALLKYLEEGLRHVLCMNIDPDTQESINAAIAMFIIENASKYSEQELMTNFSTMEKGLTLFVEYLEESLVPDMAAYTIH